jgi:predicted O-methyltransferase YrrM
VIKQQEQFHEHDDLEFQRLLTQEIGELLPTALTRACDLSQAHAVLEIGCGPGYWLCEMARAYPHLSCIGLDQDEGQISSANALAQQLGLMHTTFLARRLDDLSSTLFPTQVFDLVHLNLLGRYVLTANYPALAQACASLCRPDGMLCWMEAELPIANSPVFERLTSLVCEALQRAGQSFITESMWQWAEHFAARSGETGLARSTYKRRHLGITPMLGRWLRDAGCGVHPETPIYSLWRTDAHVTQETAYAIEVSAGQPAHEGFVRQASRFAHQVEPFLLRTGVIEEMEHAAVCDPLEGELASHNFCGLSYFLQVWAPRL